MYNSGLYRTFFYFILDSTITCCCFYYFASLVGIPIEITSSAIGLEVCAVTAAIKNISQ